MNTIVLDSEHISLRFEITDETKHGSGVLQVIVDGNLVAAYTRVYARTFGLRLLRVLQSDDRTDGIVKSVDVSVVESEAGYKKMFCVKKAEDGALFYFNSSDDLVGLSWAIDNNEREAWAHQLRDWLLELFDRYGRMTM